MTSAALSSSVAPRLSDQVGAIALIDEMRHQHMVVKEHLALDERRQEVTRRIREFYSAQGAQVSDEMVEQGVRRYFDQRLVHEPAKMGKLASKLAAVYIERALWARRSLITMATATVLIGGPLIAMEVIEGRQRAGYAEQMALAEQTSKALENELSKKQEITGSRARMLAAASTPSAAIQNLKAAQDELTIASDLVKRGPTQDTLSKADQDVEKLLTFVGAREAYNGALKNSLDAAQLRMDRSERFVRVADRLNRTLAMPTTAAAMQEPAISDMANFAKTSLERADPDQVEPVEQAVARFEAGASSFSAIAGLRESAQSTRQRLAALKLDPAERTLADAPIAAFDQALRSLNTAGARAALNQASALVALSDVDLKAEIVSRANMKTAVERTFTPSGTVGAPAKSWYVLVELIDPAGKPYPVDVKSSETGQTKNVTVFGVRITKAEFDRIRADKTADGQVDEKLMGTKPRGRLMVQYGGRAAQPLSSITEY